MTLFTEIITGVGEEEEDLEGEGEEGGDLQTIKMVVVDSDKASRWLVEEAAHDLKEVPFQGLDQRLEIQMT